MEDRENLVVLSGGVTYNSSDSREVSPGEGDVLEYVSGCISGVVVFYSRELHRKSALPYHTLV